MTAPTNPVEKKGRQASWSRWLDYSQSKALRRSLLVVIAILVILLVRSAQQGLSSTFSLDPLRAAYITIELSAIIDPIGALPMFLVFVGDLSADGRKKVVETMTSVAVGLLLFFALLGQPLLQVLGINVNSFEFGGGIILIALALDMLFAGPEKRTISVQDVAVVPLATPLLVGPGTMTALIVLTNQAQTSILDVLIGSGAAALFIYLVFYFSEYIFRLLGQNGIKAISRLFTIILAAIAAQMIHSALLGWGVAKF